MPLWPSTFVFWYLTRETPSDEARASLLFRILQTMHDHCAAGTAVLLKSWKCSSKYYSHKIGDCLKQGNAK